MAAKSDYWRQKHERKNEFRKRKTLRDQSWEKTQQESEGLWRQVMFVCIVEGLWLNHVFLLYSSKRYSKLTPSLFVFPPFEARNLFISLRHSLSLVNFLICFCLTEPSSSIYLTWNSQKVSILGSFFVPVFFVYDLTTIHFPLVILRIDYTHLI